MSYSRKLVSSVICLLAAASATFSSTVISTSDTIAFDTTAITYSINGGMPVTGILEAGAARFDFAGLELQSGATVTITRANPLLIVSNGNIIVNTAIDVSGKATVLGAAGVGGPAGGGDGGIRPATPGIDSTADGKGFGLGGGGSGANTGNTGGWRGGGGGGYGGTGGINSRAFRGAGLDVFSAFAAPTYGDPQIYKLYGGSGGGGGKNYASSGGGGGAVGLKTTSGNITIDASGLIYSNGGDATTDFTGYTGTDCRYTGGGGSGGSIRLDSAGTVTINGSLSAKGGHGGCGGVVPGKTDFREDYGGGGGGGRIAIYSASGTYTGTIPATAVAGGDGGHLVVALPPEDQDAVGGPGVAGTINAYQGPMVLPGQATGPTPNDGDTGIDIHNPALAWHAGDATATAWDVYFGTDLSSMQLLGHVTTPSAGAGELTINTHYSWRVDEYNTYGTVTGAVWGFTSRGPACLAIPVGDVNGDCRVDFTDSAIFIADWLICNRQPETECWR